jgi:hypothetical protein
MATLLWVLGFGLTMASFGFLFGRAGPEQPPRISVDCGGPVPAERRRR